MKTYRIISFYDITKYVNNQFVKLLNICNEYPYFWRIRYKDDNNLIDLYPSNTNLTKLIDKSMSELEYLVRYKNYLSELKYNGTLDKIMKDLEDCPETEIALVAINTGYYSIHVKTLIDFLEQNYNIKFEPSDSMKKLFSDE